MRRTLVSAAPVILALLAVSFFAQAGEVFDPSNGQGDGTQLDFQYTTPGGKVMQWHMHACPAGYVMRGAHFSKNVFLCKDLSSLIGRGRPSVVNGPGPVFIDGGNPPAAPTELVVGGVQMHVCPLGTVMIGADVTTNAFACQLVGLGNLTALNLHSPSTEQQGMPGGGTMHICNVPGSKFIMSGANDSQNMFACDLLR